jgi:hypothetical protein
MECLFILHNVLLNYKTFFIIFLSTLFNIRKKYKWLTMFSYCDLVQNIIRICVKTNFTPQLHMFTHKIRKHNNV